MVHFCWTRVPGREGLEACQELQGLGECPGVATVRVLQVGGGMVSLHLAPLSPKFKNVAKFRRTTHDVPIQANKSVPEAIGLSKICIPGHVLLELILTGGVPVDPLLLAHRDGTERMVLLG